MQSNANGRMGKAVRMDAAGNNGPEQSESGTENTMEYKVKGFDHFLLVKILKIILI
jgi:hypothetical protein